MLGVLVVGGARHELKIAVERRDQPPHGNLPRRLGQAVSPVDAALAFDHPDLAQLLEDVRHERLRQPMPLRQIPRAGAVPGTGKLHQRQDRVIDLTADEAHGERRPGHFS